MSKIAFMFPGQGSYEAGMGRDVAEAVPEAMAVYEAGSAASGLDLYSQQRSSGSLTPNRATVRSFSVPMQRAERA